MIELGKVGFEGYRNRIEQLFVWAQNEDTSAARTSVVTECWGISASLFLDSIGGFCGAGWNFLRREMAVIDGDKLNPMGDLFVGGGRLLASITMLAASILAIYDPKGVANQITSFRTLLGIQQQTEG